MWGSDTYWVGRPSGLCHVDVTYTRIRPIPPFSPWSTQPAPLPLNTLPHVLVEITSSPRPAPALQISQPVYSLQESCSFCCLHQGQQCAWVSVTTDSSLWGLRWRPLEGGYGCSWVLMLFPYNKIWNYRPDLSEDAFPSWGIYSSLPALY